MLETATGYYQYLNAKAQVVARQANLEEARRNLAAADERHRAGVATIADVLQAKTAASQAELVLQIVEGQVQVVRGALATTIGVPATVPVDVGELPEELPLDAVQQGVDELIAQAVEERPDLAAQRFRVLAAESRIHAAAVDGLPALTLDALGNRTFYYTPNARDPFATNWAGAITLRIPIFRGFDTAYQVQRAREEAELAKATADRTENDVILDVWTSYYDLQTAAQRVRTTRDLLTSASQSAEVADGRYRAGVGSILDLLTAQSALADARSQEAQARSFWFLSMAQLAHATGALRPAGRWFPACGAARDGGRAMRTRVGRSSRRSVLAAVLAGVRPQGGAGRRRSRAGRRREGREERRPGRALGDRQRRGAPDRGGEGPRRGRDRPGRLPRGPGRPAGRSPLHDRPAPLPGRARRGAGAARARPGAREERRGDGARYADLVKKDYVTPEQYERCARGGRRAGDGAGRRGRRRERAAAALLHADHGADVRADRQHPRPPGQHAAA